MHPTRPRTTRRQWLAASAAAAVLPAWAQPPNPVRILVGAPPGGTTDTMARTLAQEMGRLLGRTVVVENRAGAGGNIAADAVAKAAPDGQTLLMSFTSHAINASLYPTLPFDPERDFTPLTMVSTSSAWTTSIDRPLVSCAASKGRICRSSPTSTISTPNSRAASTAPSTSGFGWKSLPMASTTIRMSPIIPEPPRVSRERITATRMSRITADTTETA